MKRGGGREFYSVIYSLADRFAEKEEKLQIFVEAY